MTTISPIIDSDKIVEVLFDNAEEIPNDVYLKIMNLMKQYHEHGNNEREIRHYLKSIDRNILNKFDHFIVKQPCCTINISCNDDCTNIKYNWCVIAIFIFLSGLSSLIYFLYKYNNSVKSP